MQTGADMYLLVYKHAALSSCSEFEPKPDAQGSRDLEQDAGSHLWQAEQMVKRHAGLDWCSSDSR